MPIDNALNPDPTGGVPQADTERVARGLMGDDMINRYGDALGVRPATTVDHLRDFTMGMTHGADKVTALKLQVQDAYAKRQLGAQRLAVAEAMQKKQKVMGLFDGIEKLRTVQPNLRAAIAKEVFTGLGYENVSPAWIKVASDPDFFDGNSLSKLRQLVNDGDPVRADELAQQMVGGDVGKAVDLVNGIKAADYKERQIGSASLNQAIRLKQVEQNDEKIQLQREAATRPTAATRTMQETAPKVISLLDRLEADLAKVKASPTASRYQEFMTGKIGAPNKDWTAYRTNASLSASLLARMHVGARGSEYAMNQFKDLLAAGRQSPENMQEAIDTIRAYAADVAGGPAAKTTLPAGPKTALGGAASSIKATAQTLADKVNRGEMTRDEARAQLQALQSGEAGQ